LLGSEIAFDRNQTAARIIDETGGFRSDFTPQPDVEEESVKEQVEYPNWRLAGVIVGDAVIALLDMGTRVVEIRPGAPVTETEWICISIDNDSAVLRHRRDVTPKEVTIYLAAQLFGAPAGGGGGAGSGASKDPEVVRLEELLNKLNDLFPEITDTDRINLFNNAKAKMLDSEELRKQANANTEDQFIQSPKFEEEMLDSLISSMDSHRAMTTKLLNDDKLRARFKDLLARSVFNDINRPGVIR
jgi:type I restriction enzyme R subunit